MDSRRILRNTAFNIAGRFWMLLVNLFLTPLILSYLGDTRFALWALFWSATVWFSLMDLGLGVSVIREVAEAKAEGRHEDIGRIVSSAIVFNLMIALLVWAACLVLAPYIATALHVSSVLIPDTIALLSIGPLVFLLLGLINVLTNCLRGLQRYDLINLILFVVSFANIAGVWLALHWSLGIPGLLAAVAGVYALQLALVRYALHRIEGDLAFGMRLASLDWIRRMLPFGLRLQVANLAELASYHADKFILARFVPLYFVTVYDLGGKVASVMRDLPYMLTSAIFPAATQLHARKDEEKFWSLYTRGSKYLWVCTTPLFFGLVLTAHLLILVWLGYVAEEVYHTVLVLGFAYWVVVNQAMWLNVAIATGWSKPVMHAAIVQTVANIALSWWWVGWFGLYGALAATALTLTVVNLGLYLRFCMDFRHNVMMDLRIFAHVLLANVLPAAACAGYLSLSHAWIVPVSRSAAWPPLLGAMVIYAAVYLLSIRMVGLLDAEDARLLRLRPAWLAKVFIRSASSA